MSPPGFVAAADAEGLFVTTHEDAPCLVALHAEGREALAVELERRVADERSVRPPLLAHATRSRKLFGTMEERPATPWPYPRPRLRPAPRGDASVLFVGVGGAVEMWLQAVLQQGTKFVGALALAPGRGGVAR